MCRQACSRRRPTTVRCSEALLFSESNDIGWAMIMPDRRVVQWRLVGTGSRRERSWAPNCSLYQAQVVFQGLGCCQNIWRSEYQRDAGKATARRIFCADFTNVVFLKQWPEGTWRAFMPSQKVMIFALNNLVECRRGVSASCRSVSLQTSQSTTVEVARHFRGTSQPRSSSVNLLNQLPFQQQVSLIL